MFYNYINKHKGHLLIFIAGVLLGSAIVACQYNYITNKDDFLKFTLIQIFQILFNIFIAIFVMYFIRNTLNITKEKRAFWRNTAAELKETICSIDNLQHEYISSGGDKNTAIQIVHQFDNASNILTFILDDSCQVHDVNHSKEVLNSFIKYKKSVTAEPFQANEITYSADRISSIQICYRRLIRNINMLNYKFLQ